MKKRMWQWFKTIGSTLAFVWVFTHGVAQATVVPTESMVPSILVGDHFFLDKVAFPANYPEALQKFLPARTINRGDIVALWSPENNAQHKGDSPQPQEKLRLVKRVIGLPGETLEIRHRQLYIDGRMMEEPYVVFTDSQEINGRDNFGPVTVPSGQYFLMGDNRDKSHDSRFWGFAPFESFIGKPLFVYWSYEDAPYAQELTFKQWLEHSASVAAHFFTRTRWLRTGTVLR